MKKQDILKCSDEEFNSIWEESLKLSEGTVQKRLDKINSGSRDAAPEPGPTLLKYPGDRQFDKLLSEMGIDIDAIVIRSLFRQETSAGNLMGWRPVIEKVLRKDFGFADKEECRRFFQCSLSLWNQIMDEHNTGKRRESETLRTIRKKCLDIVLANLVFVRSLDEKGLMPEGLPKDFTKIFLQGEAMVLGSLALLEKHPEEAESKEAAAFMGAIDQIEAALREMRAQGVEGFTTDAG